MSLYDQFSTNKQAETVGIWIKYDLEDGKPSPRFLVARVGGSNIKFSKALAALMKPHQYAMQNGSLSIEKQNAIVLEAFCSTVLLNWENVVTQDGAELAFCKENAIGLFTDLPELYEDLKGQASSMALFKQQQLEAVAKN